MNTYILATLLFALTFLFQYLLNVAKNQTIDRLSTYLVQGNYAAFDELIQKRHVNFLISKFDIMYLKINRAMISLDTDSVQRMLSAFNDDKMTDRQKESLYSLAFNYFISVNDKQNAKRSYDKFIDLPNIRNRDNYRIIYDIYVEDGYRYLNDILAQIDKCDDSEKEHLSLLIEKMQENKANQNK